MKTKFVKVDGKKKKVKITPKKLSQLVSVYWKQLDTYRKEGPKRREFENRKKTKERHELITRRRALKNAQS